MKYVPLADEVDGVCSVLYAPLSELEPLSEASSIKPLSELRCGVALLSEVLLILPSRGELLHSNRVPPCEEVMSCVSATEMMGLVF